MRNELAILVWLLLFGNIIFQFLQLVINLRRLRYSKEVEHKFLCLNCQQFTCYLGDKLKQNMKKSRDSQTVNGYTTTIYQIYCENCKSFTRQIEQFQHSFHKRWVSPIISYNVDYKMTDYAKPYFKKFLLRGLLPVPFLFLLFVYLVNK